MSTQTFDVGAGPHVHVRIERGMIVLLAGTDGQVGVELAGPGADDLTVEGGPSGVTIRSSGRLLRSGGKVDVRVTVPADTHATLALASGAIDVRGPVAELHAAAASGNVTATSLAGRATIKTASGDISVDDAHGDITLTSGSGDARLGRLEGHGQITSASGDLVIGDLSGTVTCKTASGDVAIRRMHEGSLTFRTVSGDTTIGILPARHVSYDITAVSGELRLPDPTSRPASTGDGPKPRVRIEGRSVSGDTTLVHAVQPGE